MGNSLWLVPNPSIAMKVKTVMQHKPVLPLRSPSSFPAFHPHVTLASSSDAASLRAAIPSDQRVVPISFKSLDVGTKYFMSVFVAVYSPPGSALETLRSHLRGSLGDSAIPPLPHLSLYYIDEADKEERGRTAEMLKRELRVLESGRGEESAVTLACFDVESADESIPQLLTGFEGEEIWLVKCEGRVESWDILEKFPLTM